MRSISSRRAMAVPAIVSAVLTVATVASPVSAATSLPTLRVTPSTKLVNKEKVQLTGTGFPKKHKVYAVECLKAALTLAGCDVAHRVSFTTTAAGSFPKKFFFTVHTGKVGTGTSAGTCGTTAKNAKRCAIAIGSGSRSYAGAAITFKG
jgi:hypothetical protein